jgi:hypothetical protein
MVHRGFAYVGHTFKGCSVIDVRMPAQPKAVRSLHIGELGRWPSRCRLLGAVSVFVLRALRDGTRRCHRRHRDRPEMARPGRNEGHSGGRSSRRWNSVGLFLRAMADDITSQIRGPRLLVRRDGTHQALGNSVGILDDRVTCPPRCVIRLLQASVSRIDHVTEHIVDICAGGHSKSMTTRPLKSARCIQPQFHTRAKAMESRSKWIA